MKGPRNDRERLILATLVEEYIRVGEPVASGALARLGNVGLSPASIRKSLAELEGLGLLSQAHSSAGRTPTEMGFRSYVNDLLANMALSERAKDIIEESLAAGDPESIFSLCSRVLSNLTSQMGLIVAPGADRLWLKRLFFVSLAPGEALAVLVTENGLIHNRILSPSEDYDQDQLNEVNNFLETLATPFTLEEIRDIGLAAMSRERREFERLYQRVLALVAEAAAKEETLERPIFLDGEGRERLWEHPDLAAAETMRALFLAFENKRRLVELLDDIAEAGKVQVVFGPSGQKDDGLALVASPYFRGDKGAGALGVLGPRRLNYSEVLPVVDYAARVLSGLMKK
ncbi:MAG: heat-inducible transcriptional repressor HrcA [Deltaproteobacteria bacterium]|jgi:heat-inducible transcriptional repressor|nr:heat-inducible transcriptional repressor HrcA [Deltaproteobacteria bacterium]